MYTLCLFFYNSPLSLDWTCTGTVVSQSHFSCHFFWRHSESQTMHRTWVHPPLAQPAKPLAKTQILGSTSCLHMHHQHPSLGPPSVQSLLSSIYILLHLSQSGPTNSLLDWRQCPFYHLFFISALSFTSGPLLGYNSGSDSISF